MMFLVQKGKEKLLLSHTDLMPYVKKGYSCTPILNLPKAIRTTQEQNVDKLKEWYVDRINYYKQMYNRYRYEYSRFKSIINKSED